MQPYLEVRRTEVGMPDVEELMFVGEAHCCIAVVSLAKILGNFEAFMVARTVFHSII